MKRNSKHEQFTEERGNGRDPRLQPSLSEEYFRSVTDNDEPAEVHANPRRFSPSAYSFESFKTHSSVFVLDPPAPACGLESNVGNARLRNRQVSFNKPTSHARNNCERAYTWDLWGQSLTIKSKRATHSSVYTPWDEHYNRKVDTSQDVGAFDTYVDMAREETQWRDTGLHEIFSDNEAREGKEREIQNNKEETETNINVFQRHSNGQITNTHPYQHHQSHERGHQPTYTTNVVYEVLKLHPGSQDHHDSSESPSQVLPLTQEHLERFNFLTNKKMQLYNFNTSHNVDKNPEPSKTSSEHPTSKTKQSSKKSNSKQKSSSKQSSAESAESEKKRSEKELPSNHESVSTDGSSHRSASGHQSRKKDESTHRSSRHKSSKTDGSSRTHKSTKKPGYVKKVEEEQSTSEDGKEKRTKTYCHCRKKICKCKKDFCESRDRNNKSDSKSQIAQVHWNTKKKVSSSQTKATETQRVGCKKTKHVEEVKSPCAASISKSPTKPSQTYEPPVKDSPPKSLKKKTPPPSSSSQTYEPPVKEPPPKPPRKIAQPTSLRIYEPPVKQPPPTSPKKETPPSSSQAYEPPLKEQPPKSPRKETPPPYNQKYQPPVKQPPPTTPRKETTPLPKEKYISPFPPRYESPVKQPPSTSPRKETKPLPKENYIFPFPPRYESPVKQQPTPQRNEKLQPLSPKNQLSLPPRYESPNTKLPPPITTIAGKVAKDEQAIKSISKQPLCPQRQNPSNKDNSRPKPVSGNYKPIWYQKTGSNSSEWIDGSTYYDNLKGPSNHVGAFAPHVNVEQMVRLEKRMRHIKDQKPYSDEDFTRSGRRRKKSARSEQSTTVQQHGTGVKTTQGKTRSNYVMNLHGTSQSSRWNYDVLTTPKRPNRSTSVFTSIFSKKNRPHVLFDYIHRYSSTPLLATESSVCNMTNVSSGLAPSTVGFQAYNASIGYNQKCDCIIDNCKCLYDCTSRNKPELTNRKDCLNMSELSACSRGEDGSVLNVDTSGGSRPKKRGKKRSAVLMRRRSSGGDFPGDCSCQIEDCYCIYDPCESRKRAKRRLKIKPPKPKKVKKYVPPNVKPLEQDKFILCHSDAIEIPFNWCMRTFCVTWVWSDREFKRHCGKELGPLPDYTQKPPSLNESWLQRWWNSRYVGEDDENEFT